MDERQAFLDAIVANPDDIGLRLVYADWLEEQSDPRAEFIRLQIQRDDLLPFNCRYDGVHQRLNELLQKYGYSWYNEARFPTSLGTMEFRRGFVEKVRFNTVTAALQAGERLRAVAPVRNLSFFRMSDHDFDQFVHSDELSHYVELDLQGHRFHSNLANILTSSGSLGQLRTLNLFGTRLRSEGLRDLVRQDNWRSLGELRLGYNDIGLAGIEAFLASPLPARLHTLQLDHNRMGIRAARALVNHEHWRNLRKLEFNSCPLGNEGFRLFCQSKNFLILEQLDFNTCEVGPDIPDIGGLAPALCNLHSLSLHDNRLYAAAAQRLAHIPELRRLQGLWLGNNNLNNRGAQELADAPYLGNLRLLDLRLNEIGDRGVSALAESPYLRNLVHLDLSCNQIGNQGAIALANSRYLNNLTILHLAGNRIGSTGLNALVRARQSWLAAKVL